MRNWVYHYYNNADIQLQPRALNLFLDIDENKIIKNLAPRMLKNGRTKVSALGGAIVLTERKP